MSTLILIKSLRLFICDEHAWLQGIGGVDEYL